MAQNRKIDKLGGGEEGVHYCEGCHIFWMLMAWQNTDIECG